MTFLTGLDLASTYYEGAVRPLLDRHFPGLPHSAALLGQGSDVAGLDTERSRDHDWGPRMQLFLADTKHVDAVTEMLAEALPVTWHGFPTRFTLSRHPEDPPKPQVTVAETRTWLRGQLGFDPCDQVTTRDWLATPTQRLAEMTMGRVFHDGLGDLTVAHTNLAWYPDRVWRHVLACQWHRIAQEEAFPGRCAEVGDALGSAVVTARLVRDMMRLALLMRREYPLYSKWLGTQFSKKEGPLQTHLLAALSTQDWKIRETHLTRSYELLAEQHNNLSLTPPIDPTTRTYYNRPFKVLDADRFTNALTTNNWPPHGAIDQFVDNTDATGNTTFTQQITIIQPM